MVTTRTGAAFFLVAALFLIFCAAGSYAPARDGLRLLAAKDDPVALADAQLDRILTPARFAQGLDAALDAGDADLARSFMDLGRARGLPPAAAQEARLATLEAQAKELAVEDFAEGFLHGGRDNRAAFAGALTGDLTGYGDLRDLWKEAEKIRRGESPDELVVGLATAGLALSVVTLSSLGAALPARSGLSLLKGAQKAGRLSQPLTKSLVAASAKALDREALAASLSAAAKLDVAAARTAAGRVLRPGALASFRLLGADAALLYRRAGARGLADALALAEDSAQLRKAAQLAAAAGGRTRAILATLGRGALVFGGLAATAAVEAMFVGLGAMVGLAMLAQRFGFWLGRRRAPWAGRRRGATASGLR
ncbi:hypothetical protein [Methylocystis echinoides]|uniref:Uncharacterized protein n=1 Tax=Methylocystis echinoides TaxID=29468 RepID=A0A9W6LSA7_9HYPH|nr:hypothetical protein [Methylocystis echinoides]GLI93261.1 hypothetical protein LMG27198_22530 [Methylocystis echinoides]